MKYSVVALNNKFKNKYILFDFKHEFFTYKITFSIYFQLLFFVGKYSLYKDTNWVPGFAWDIHINIILAPWLQSRNTVYMSLSCLK